MKVLIQSRENFFTMRGGDTVQIEKTKEQLEKLGVEVDISLELEPDLTNYDLVHLTNVTRIQETFIQMKNAKRQGKKVALSTIFWPMEDFEKNAQIGIRKAISKFLSIDNIERIKALVRIIKSKEARTMPTRNLITNGYTAMQRYVVENTDLFLPNSEMEINKLFEVFKTNNRDYVVVPNGIDKGIALKYLNMDTSTDFSEYNNAVICVGRIEPRKNQLSLLRALEGSDYTVLLVGAVSNNHKNYFSEIKKILDSNPKFHYIPRIDNAKLYALYKVCKVNTLPSWLDTPGLVNLESSAMGCNLAISSKGTTTEYFGDEAFYCEPDDIKSIRNSIDEAFNAPRSKKLQEKVLSDYTWENAARQTLLGYKKLLEC